MPQYQRGVCRNGGSQNVDFGRSERACRNSGVAFAAMVALRMAFGEGLPH